MYPSNMTVATLVEDLKSSVGEGKVFPPEAPKYEDLIKRWCDSSIRRAVSTLRTLTRVGVADHSVLY